MDVRRRIKELGYAGLGQFFMAHQTEPFTELAVLLKCGRPVDARTLQFEEFPFTVHAKLSLVRDIHLLLPHGLPEEREGVFKVANAYSHWLNFLTPGELGPKKPLLIEAWSKMEALAPADWLPKSIDDPVIAAAFKDLHLDDG